MKNMRKFISVLLAVVCLCACVASAEVVQSPTKPVAAVTQIATEAVVEGDTDPFVIESVETELWSEAAIAQHEEIAQILADPQVAPVAIFTEEEMTAAAEILPDEYDTTALTIAEYIPLNVINYVSEIGSATVCFEVPGEYTAEDVIIAMFKPFTGAESSWIALEAKLAVAEEDASAAETDASEETEVTSSIEVLFPQEVLEMVTANEGALLILRG